MPHNEPVSFSPRDHVRTAAQEIADLLATALLRLRALDSLSLPGSECEIPLAMNRVPSVNANPYLGEEVRT